MRRGEASEWMVSHAELQRIRNEGLLPLQVVPPVYERRRRG